MKKIIAIIVFGSFLLSCSCTKEDNSIPTSRDANGVITEKQYLWWNKEEEHDNYIITTPFIYNGSFIAETHQNGNSYLSLQNAKDGKIIWKWDDYVFDYDIDLRYPYGSQEGYLFFQSGPRTYCVNLKSGKTQWKETQSASQFSLTSGYFDEGYMLQDFPDDGDVYPGFKIYDLENGNLKDKIIPKFINISNRNVSGELGSISSVVPYILDNKKNLLVSFAEPINEHINKGFLGLYNYEDKVWVYDRRLINENYGLGLLQIYNNKAYCLSGDTINCLSIEDGKIIWKKGFKGNFVFGGFMLDQGTLYCAAEGDGYYALNAETGAIKWKGERAPGTSSRMVVLNGVLYYINGGDGRLWALDAATGKTLWRLKSPDGYSFKREINVMQGDGERKGYVLTSTWHGACAYEAER
ncbi:MAG TPA: PQQ-binding-like beta-propeller repeat protein [Saprospiraceae bacterium]|nr:PQQ-binding-like beta-propeller repeat protein [Saprospiraceae bacterium]